MSDKLKFAGLFKGKHGTYVDVSVNLVQFKDSSNHVIYAPALEVYGYGKTVDEAKKSFVTCLEEFIDYTRAKGTVTSELKRLGWTIKGRKKNRTFKIPDFAHLLAKNERLIDIMNDRDVRTFKADIPMAIPA